VSASPEATAEATAQDSVDHSGRQSSWGIRDKETGETVLETFDRKVVDALNTAKYEAVPVGQHLAQLNRQGRNAERTEVVASETDERPVRAEAPARTFPEFVRRQGLKPSQLKRNSPQWNALREQ